MPYSCQLQFGTSGRSGTPVGAGRTCRAIGLEMSQTSRLTMDHTTMRAPPGSLRGGRSTMAEYSQRSRGIIGGEPVMSDILSARLRTTFVYATLGRRGESASNRLGG